jgi:hypothetical protein
MHRYGAITRLASTARLHRATRETIARSKPARYALG